MMKRKRKPGLSQASESPSETGLYLFPRVLVLVVIAGVARMLLPGSVHADETYRFERTWPVLEQPWYHSHAPGIGMFSELRLAERTV